jgi:hypothetical protein
MQSIVLVSALETQNWKSCFNHHGMPYHEIDYWENSDKLFSSTQSYIVVDIDVLSHMIKYCFDKISNLLQANKIIAVAATDSPVIFRNNYAAFQQLDQLIQSKNLTCLLDCVCYEHDLKNILVEYDAESRFFEMIEQRVSVRLQKSHSKDFLLCMGRQDFARDQLWHTIHDTVDCQNSIMIYHGWGNYDPDFQGYLGDNPAPLLWQRSQVPSLDFYNSCCFELVAETFTDTAIWFTEKTLRPIAAKTPFVILGTPGILKSLKNLGFKTFDQYIDESYDCEPNLCLRTQQISSTVSSILTNGAAEFATAVQDIVEHNWQRLTEIKGLYQIKKDISYLSYTEKILPKHR